MSDNEFYKHLIDELDEGLYFVDMQRNITFWNKAAERITGFSSEEVTGRPCHDNILNHVDVNGVNLCTGMCPLAYTLQDKKHRESDVFLHHKNGTRIPVHVKISPITDETGATIGALELFSDNSSILEMTSVVEDLKKKALFDSLTGAGNRTYCDQILDLRVDEFNRYHWPFGMIFFDIDNFKKFNDDYSHAVGDMILKIVSGTIMNNIRSFDFLGRFGGEEFIVVIRNIDSDMLFKRAEMLRSLIAQSYCFHNGQQLKVTVSGGATMMKKDDTVRSFLERADKLMYESKKNGKNRITRD